MHVAASGTVTAFTGKVDVGQDNQTALRLLAAEELAVDPGGVRLVQGDTDLCPYDPGTFGSRGQDAAAEEWLRQSAPQALTLISEHAGPARIHVTARVDSYGLVIESFLGVGVCDIVTAVALPGRRG